MKKVILVLTFLTIGFISCGEYCETCTTTTTLDGVEQGSSSSAAYCGDALDEMRGKGVTNNDSSVSSTICK